MLSDSELLKKIGNYLFLFNTHSAKITNATYRPWPGKRMLRGYMGCAPLLRAHWWKLHPCQALCCATLEKISWTSQTFQVMQKKASREKEFSLQKTPDTKLTPPTWNIITLEVLSHTQEGNRTHWIEWKHLFIHLRFPEILNQENQLSSIFQI